MSCFMCKGNLEDKLTNFIADLGNCIIIVKDVPSQVCSQCGEVSYSNDVALQLEKIINKTKSTLTEITVVRYSNVA
ncbi:type II toxin-antitoxin system MqsA family antitoxin [Anaerotignum sp. MSJ-24]|uniref:type II toxin-antitoxin system MqsA family antitoxin n=1 Tax=Anaerotignum sp. MSJ-24 TaxID=2841521 RepID=UPI001C106E27|nr:type II toxin-antitoxin system MqsA family antitoxin [Anaerotignum sp. MSJ-24]MBU5464541.1 type II toxin-antitoxin system MqsA family antitoxin [Anaerotignum sp. MSJ-24]